MQGMIMHHAQAVEMTALIETRTQNKDLRLLGARISHSQSDEMKFMKRWLEVRGVPVSPPVSGMARMQTHDPHTPGHQMLMPGMLTEAQMKELDQSRGSEFDRLFLHYMIQHHKGAVTMVKELFETPRAAQDETTFKLASDVSADQSSEITRMEQMLAELGRG